LQRFDLLHKVMVPEPMSYSQYKESTLQRDLSVCPSSLKVSDCCGCYLSKHLSSYTFDGNLTKRSLHCGKVLQSLFGLNSNS
jgi:hypothetical protein